MAAAIIGNSFGVQGRNQGGNVYDNGAVDAAPKYKPNARTRLDVNGNFHAVTASISGSRTRLSSR